MILDEVTAAAVTDAGYEPTDVLVVRTVQPINGNEAISWYRGDAVNHPDETAPLGLSVMDLNSAANRGLVRCAVRVDQGPEIYVALLRHELEHGRQYDLHGRKLDRLRERALTVLWDNLGSHPGGGVLYNQIPMEADANSAGSTVARSIFGADRIDALAGETSHGALLRGGPLGDLSTLVKRMEAFIEVAAPAACLAFLDEHG